MFVPVNSSARQDDTLLNRNVDTLISNNNVTTLKETGNDRRGGGHGLGVKNAALGTNKRSNVVLALSVNILVTVKSSRATRAHTVAADGLDCLGSNYGVVVEVKHIGREEIEIDGVVLEVGVGVGDIYYR